MCPNQTPFKILKIFANSKSCLTKIINKDQIEAAIRRVL